MMQLGKKSSRYLLMRRLRKWNNSCCSRCVIFFLTLTKHWALPLTERNYKLCVSAVKPWTRFKTMSSWSWARRSSVHKRTPQCSSIKFVVSPLEDSTFFSGATQLRVVGLHLFLFIINSDDDDHPPAPQVRAVWCKPDGSCVCLTCSRTHILSCTIFQRPTVTPTKGCSYEKCVCSYVCVCVVGGGTYFLSVSGVDTWLLKPSDSWGHRERWRDRQKRVGEERQGD